MKKILVCIITILSLSFPVSAQTLEPPEPPSDVEYLLSEDNLDFAESIWYVIRTAIEKVSPDITQALRICVSVIGAVLLVSLFLSFQSKAKPMSELIMTVAVATILLSGTNALIHEAAQTVTRLSDYGKLFIPVMTAALASQGGVTSAGAIYTATAMFDTVISALVQWILIPMVYVYLALSIANSAIGEEILKNLRDFLKWAIGWSMKTLLYIFTGYVTITGVISGVTDMTAMKATKLTISGMVPVVGGILSEASEAVLVGAGAVKNTVGVAGLVTILAMLIGPFLRIGIHYLLLKFTSAVTSMFADGKRTELIQDFSTSMGFLLAMTGAVGIMLFISTVCMMRCMGG